MNIKNQSFCSKFCVGSLDDLDNLDSEKKKKDDSFDLKEDFDLKSFKLDPLSKKDLLKDDDETFKSFKSKTNSFDFKSSMGLDDKEEDDFLLKKSALKTLFCVSYLNLEFL